MSPLQNLSTEARRLWGKTGDRRGRTGRSTTPDWHPLVAHMVDSREIAGRLWDDYLSRAFRSGLATGMPGDDGAKETKARAFFTWLAALHDLGKASPGHQALSTTHFARVAEVLPEPARPEYHPHNLVSGHLVAQFLAEEGWSNRAAGWVADVLAGHHGIFPQPGAVRTPLPEPQVGGTAWRRVQRELYDACTELCGVNLGELRGYVPPIGTQLACSGAVILADWVASDERLFPLVREWAPGYPEESASRAVGFRATMQFSDVWRPAPPDDARQLYRERFAIASPYDTQLAVHEVARQAHSPGLMVIEAPTGEGKTEAALAAAEVLAARFGFNGLFFGLPTQATSNQVFDRVLAGWLRNQPQAIPPTVGLAHGKATRHETFTDLPLGDVGDWGNATATASQWMRGRKKTLLAPITVGTIDQLLFAGVSSPHVMLRHLALANKVVVIDEVHAYDAYMSRILHRVLHWLGLHGVPVILLSATLPRQQRTALLTAYAGGEVTEDGTHGYPLVSWVRSRTPEERKAGASFFTATDTAAAPSVWFRPAAHTERRGSQIALELRSESRYAHDAVAADIAERTAHGGCVLVIRNTIARAQETYDALKERFAPHELTLAHARFTTDDRSDIDAKLRTRFGPPVVGSSPDQPTVETPERPARHVVVSTQVTEQSLDLDFDLVVTDLAPIDLLLQRAGRLHRHQRPGPRPDRLARPTLVVTGFTGGDDTAPPKFATWEKYPYLHHFLFRTLATLRDRAGIANPQDVPELIEAVYGEHPVGPPAWREAMEKAGAFMAEVLAELRTRAAALLLSEPDPALPTLTSLMRRSAHEVDEETAGNHLRVRSGEPSVEVVLLRRLTSRTARTVSRGEPSVIPLDRTPSAEQIERILGQTLRLPLRLVDTERLEAPSGWRHSPLCQPLRVLILSKDSGGAYHAKKNRTYSTETGWTMCQDTKTESPPHSFNLVDQPWIPYVLSSDGTHGVASLREVLVRAHEIRDVTVDFPTQYPALLRFLLAVLHRALGVQDGKQSLSQPRNRGFWAELYSLERFPEAPINEYLDTWIGSFDLFHPTSPFLQVGNLSTSNKSRKPSSLLVPYAASGNNAPIFSSTRDNDPIPLSPEEAARWLLHLHAWDTAGIKTGAVGDPRAKQGKTTGNRTGPLGSLGVLIPTGSTLWETLMFNLTILSEDSSPESDLPVWERDSLSSAWRERFPVGVVDLYTWPSRRVRLFPEAIEGDTRVREVLVCAGDRFTDLSTLQPLEPHSAFKGAPPPKDENGKQPEKGTDDSAVRHRPIRHVAGHQLWRGLGGILGRRHENGAPFQDHERPHTLSQLGELAKGLAELLAELFGEERAEELSELHQRVIQIRAFGVFYGIQNAVIEETYYDTLPLPVALLRPGGKHSLDSAAVGCVDDSEKAAWALGRLAADVALCSGADPDAQKVCHAHAETRLYAALDQPFREWTAGLTANDKADEYRAEWHTRVRREAWRIAQDVLDNAPPSALRTRVRPSTSRAAKTHHINLPLAESLFRRRLTNAVPQARFPGTNEDGNGVSP